MVVCCAPSYLRGRKVPTHPRDLASHACLVHSALATRDEWSFRGVDAPDSVRVSGPLRTNDMEAIHAAALAGLGIAVLPSYGIADDLKSNRLRALLESFTLPPMKVWAVHTGRRHRSARLRVFLDWLVDAIGHNGETEPR
jgi:DNA-binding transcriptional LysR family regulator